MATEKVKDAAGWFMGKVGEHPKPAKKLAARGEKVEPHEVEAVVQMFGDAAGTGRQLAESMQRSSAFLREIANSGLTPDALVVLVTEKCPMAANGKPISADTVQRVLQAFFRLSEYLTP